MWHFIGAVFFCQLDPIKVIEFRKLPGFSMPIYEYQCTSCGHQLEAFQKITEAPLTDCPNCHKETLEKLISATSFQLKGTGWYATDFRDKGKPKKKETEDGEGGGAKDQSSDSAKKDTKATETKAKDSTSGGSSSSNSSAEK